MTNIMTFQYLRELQKKEKDNAELQLLDHEFYKKVSEYIGRKTRMSEQKSSFSNESQEDSTERILPIIKDIFNRRETKIINGALMSARSSIEVKNMLVEEKILFHHIKTGIVENRKRLEDILKGIVWNVELEGADSKESSAQQPADSEKLQNFLSPTVTDIPKEQQTNQDQAPKDQQTNTFPQTAEPTETVPKAQLAKLRILEDIPAFVAEDLETYGPWNKGSVVDCPEMVAGIFVKTGKAERG